MEETYFSKGHGYMDPKLTNYPTYLVKKLIGSSGLKKTDKILEIGCGPGRFSVILLKKGFPLTAIEPSDYFIDKFKEAKKKFRIKTKVNLSKASLEQFIKKSNGKFDKIIGFYILHHLENLNKNLIDLLSISKNKTKFAFIEPNPINPMWYMGIMLYGISLKEEMGMFNVFKHKIQPALKKHNLSVKIKGFGFFPPFVIDTKIGYFLERLFSYIPFIGWIRPYKLVIIEKKWKLKKY